VGVREYDFGFHSHWRVPDDASFFLRANVPDFLLRSADGVIPGPAKAPGLSHRAEGSVAVSHRVG
jgi:hypothetical protein